MKKLQDVHNGVYCFAMEGSTFEVLKQHDPKLLDKCAHRAKVFARMAPEHKQQLMEVLQNIGYIIHSFIYLLYLSMYNDLKHVSWIQPPSGDGRGRL